MLAAALVAQIAGALSDQDIADLAALYGSK
jgi:cytochrome c553